MSARNLVNIPNKEVNARMPRVSDNQTQTGELIPPTVTTSGCDQPLVGSGNRKLEDEMVTTLKACKACGEIGHLFKECPDEWPHGDTDIPTEEYPTQVTCFLCEGNNHVPAQCQLYPMVLQVSQQVKEGDRKSVV